MFQLIYLSLELSTRVSGLAPVINTQQNAEVNSMCQVGPNTGNKKEPLQQLFAVACSYISNIPLFFNCDRNFRAAYKFVNFEEPTHIKKYLCHEYLKNTFQLSFVKFVQHKSINLYIGSLYIYPLILLSYIFDDNRKDMILEK